MKSGPKICKDGTKGVFITEEDLGRSGDALKFFIRTNYQDTIDFEESGYNVIRVMGLLCAGQKNCVVYDDIEREQF